MAAGRAFLSSLVVSSQLVLVLWLLRRGPGRVSRRAIPVDGASFSCRPGGAGEAPRAPLRASPREIAAVARAFLSQEGEGRSR